MSIKYLLDCPHCAAKLEASLPEAEAEVKDVFHVTCCYCFKSIDIVNHYKISLLERGIISADEVLNLKIDIGMSSTVEELLQKVG